MVTPAIRVAAGTVIFVYLALLVLALFGAPLFAVIGASAMIAFYRADIDLSVMAIEVFGLAEMPVLVAIPLFTFAGYVLSESNAPHRLVRVTNALLGWLPGGLAIVALTACALFTAFTGASGVTIIALGALLFPALREAGYPDRFNLGLIASSGSLGLLFAPSLPLILYGIVAKTSIDDLFLAGVLPGLLMLIMLSAWSMYVSRGSRLPTRRYSGREALAALADAAWELPLPFVVLGGIYSGYFAVSEAAAVTATYVFLAEVVVRREISWRALPQLMRESMVLVGGILLILGVSLASTNYVIDSGLPERMFDILGRFVESRASFLALLIVFLLVLGAFLDIFSALVLVVPLILPVALQYDVHPVHLGILFLATMQLGYMTPPVGLNLFIASYRFDKPIMQVYAATVPFLLILLAAVIVIAYWPALSLALID